MTTVSDTLVLPGGTHPWNTVVQYELVSTDGHGFEDDGDHIVHRLRVSPDTDGRVSVDLTPNDEITPTGTVWIFSLLAW